jgi:SAM-dependent methyltransferase
VSEYILPRDDALEERRLALLESHHDPDSIAALERTGVGPGWRCLDVGAGRGPIGRWLTARGAEVLCTDLDVGALSGLDARVHDITSDEPLPEAPFDLVHTRLLLLHLPSRDAVAAKLAGLLRPGGWLVAGDIDFTVVAAAEPSDAFAETWFAWCAATTGAGWELGCGARLPEMLRAAGLEEVESTVTGEQCAGGSPALQILSLAFEKLRSRLVEHGASDAAVSEARRALEDPARSFAPPTTWTAWGHSS